ncbi:ribosomal RNA small subunit methyltransferase A [Aspergillus niger]|uniref:Ribosomal RNA small subunit methyltransferase A n=1 Tax=Aspergillus niger TaxID=5061 RepID=A0A505IH58_ASPNG|nr:ribosomal RNA small subunit methyltransferase A [Aspergillus niger]
MSSSVHFKFKSQKEPSRVTFDGTGISVFELKREIINQSRLGDGTDFELSIYNEDTGEEYDDDTSIIPRSTSVIARRLPASRPGKGGAARYVSGKMPVNARSAPRNEQYPLTRASPNTSNGVLELNNAQTEEEKINALFNLQANQWKEQQQEMANKIKEYEAEKADSKKEKDKQQANDIGPGIDKTAIQGKGPVATTESLPPIPPSQPASNKRPAEDETPRTAVGGSSPSSLSKKLKTNDKADSQTPQATGPVTGFPAFPFGQQMPFGSFGFMPNQGMPAMPLSDPMNAMGVPSSGGFPPNMDQSWNPMNAMNFNPAPGMYGDNVNSYATPNLYNGVGEPSMNMFHMPQMMGLQPNSGLAQGKKTRLISGNLLTHNGTKRDTGGYGQVTIENSKLV